MGIEMDEKISVIVPVYNVEKYLQQCLDSIINQTYRNLEIILIDDGSPDSCGAICDEYAKKDQRILVIHKENEGLSAARNEGIKKATGKWIAFVDSDDWCELDYYEQMLKEMGNSNPDILCSGGRFFEYLHKREVAHSITHPFQCMGGNECKKLMSRVLTTGCQREKISATLAAPWDKLYNSKFLQNNKLFFDISCKSCEDTWFNFQVFDKAESVKGCTYIGYHYRRQVSTSIVRGFNPKKPENNYDYISKLYHYAEQKKLDQKIFLAIEVETLVYILNSLSCYYFHSSNQKKYREIASEIREMKTWPYFHKAIWSNSNQYLTKKQLVFKYVLRLSWIWPLKLIYNINKIIKR